MSTQNRFPCGRVEKIVDRRHFLSRAGAGMGLLALADLLNRDALLADEETANRPVLPARHFPAKAQSVIWLFMEGAPSAVDVSDPKPELDKGHGKKTAIDVFNGNPGPLMKSPFQFKQYGQSGAWVCEKYRLNDEHLREHAGRADLLARIRSFELAFRMQTHAAEVVDLSKESPQTRAMYGIDHPQSRSFGSKCLMARRPFTQTGALKPSGLRVVALA